MRRLLLLFVSLAAVMPAATPNIVVVLADDLGYGDLKAYNPATKIPTPHLDRIAAEGIRLTDAHSPASVCTPTRYALLTGRYAWRTRLKSGVLNGSSPPLIDRDRLTLPEMLQQQGYVTANVGKWHLGWRWQLKDTAQKQTVENVDWTKPLLDGPNNHGFDYSFGRAEPAWTFRENDRVAALPSEKFDLTHLPAYLMGGNNNRGYRSPGWTHERMLPRFTEEAVSFIDRNAGQDKPLFLFFTPIAPHRPVVPNEAFRDTTQAGLYGDFVHEFDWAVGQLLMALERNGILDDTLFLVSSDNGPEVDAYRRILEYRHFSMGGLRGVKRDTWEGGHRVPFLARWPGHIPAGASGDETVCLTDLMASFAELTGFSLPRNAGEDSYNILPALTGKSLASPIREATVHHGSRGWFAIRQGEWVYIEDHPGDNNRGGNAEPEWFRRERMATAPDEGSSLHRLSPDGAQGPNVISEFPEKARQLATLLDRYRDSGRSTN